MVSGEKIIGVSLRIGEIVVSMLRVSDRCSMLVHSWHFFFFLP